jgi:hypothetical protein
MIKNQIISGVLAASLATNIGGYKANMGNESSGISSVSSEPQIVAYEDVGKHEFPFSLEDLGDHDELEKKLKKEELDDTIEIEAQPNVEQHPPDPKAQVESPDTEKGILDDFGTIEPNDSTAIGESTVTDFNSITTNEATGMGTMEPGIGDIGSVDKEIVKPEAVGVEVAKKSSGIGL